MGNHGTWGYTANAIKHDASENNSHAAMFQASLGFEPDSLRDGSGCARQRQGVAISRKHSSGAAPELLVESYISVLHNKYTPLHREYFYERL